MTGANLYASAQLGRGTQLGPRAASGPLRNCTAIHDVAASAVGQPGPRAVSWTLEFPVDACASRHRLRDSLGTAGRERSFVTRSGHSDVDMRNDLLLSISQKVTVDEIQLSILIEQQRNQNSGVGDMSLPCSEH
jgi:hypothetical protein